MYSVGIDCVEVSRIENSLRRSTSFAQRVFGPDEQAEIAARGAKAESFAVCFAAKEAFSKAVGTGLRGFSFADVQLLHRDSGKPFLKLNGSAAALAGDRGFDVSVTHTGGVVTAIVISFGR